MALNVGTNWSLERCVSHFENHLSAYICNRFRDNAALSQETFREWVDRVHLDTPALLFVVTLQNPAGQGAQWRSIRYTDQLGTWYQFDYFVFPRDNFGTNTGHVY